VDKVEAVARIIDPQSFRLNESMYLYCIKHGDGEEKSKETANWAHPLTEALDKARLVIATIERIEAKNETDQTK